MSNHFDKNSGIRERLALLAKVGPSEPFEQWSYNPHSDMWHASSEHSTVLRLPIKQEGSASLELIRQHWGMNRQAAMAFIGYPETR